MPYVKLDTDTLNSSLWVSDYRTRITFLTMLMLADPEGFVHAKAPGIARAAVLPIEDIRNALSELESPDPDSRSEEKNGRRIERVEGGYQIINYLKYRDKDHTHAERQRRYRERKRRERDASLSGSVTPCDASQHPNVTQAEAEAEATTSTYPEKFERAWKTYPRRKGGNPKKGAFRAWRARLNEGYTEDKMAAGVKAYAEHAASEEIDGTRFVMQAKTFFGPDCHFDQDWQGEVEQDHWE